IRMALYLGRREDLHPDTVAAFDVLAPHLAASGHGVVWASTRPVADCALVPLTALAPEVTAPLARFYGAPELRTEAWPATAVAALRLAGAQAVPHAALLQRLATLPAPIPRAAAS